MADLVIDEWLWSDLAGENTVEKQRETSLFLETVFKKCDRVVRVKGSRFDQKAMRFWRHTDVTRRTIARVFEAQFLYNSEKSVVLEEDQLQDLPTQLATAINPDDHYLVRAYLASNATVIVTTDNLLHGVLTRHSIACQQRDEFVPAYISQHR